MVLCKRGLSYSAFQWKALFIQYNKMKESPQEGGVDCVAKEKKRYDGLRALHSVLLPFKLCTRIKSILI